MMTQDCKVCLAQHDEEIHAATNRVLDWFHIQVTKHLHAADGRMLTEVEQLRAAQFNVA